MADLRTLVRDQMERAGSPSYSFNDLGRRRDHKRRNQRITAGVVGIAVFVAAFWFVRDVASLNRSEKSVVPAASGTTGPAETGPTSAGSGNPFLVDHVVAGLPPEGAALSEPGRGEVIASHDEYQGHVRAYADGRVIWQYGDYRDGAWLERRLTPLGVDLLRSQPDLAAEFASLPASVWEEAPAKQYVAARYGVCTSREAIRELPQRAQDLLTDYTNEQAVERGEEQFFAGGNGSTCPALTVAEARELDAVLTESGYRKTEETAESVWYKIHGPNPSIVFTMLLPDGSLAQSGGA